MPTNAGLSWDRVGEVLLLVHAPRTPTEEEWRALMDDPVSQNVRGMVVVANGAKPSPAQRAQIQERFGKALTSVLTDSVLTRGAVTALGWFGMPVRAFPPSAMPSALAYAGVPSSDIPRIERLLTEMNVRVAAA